jgi:hypothetical protein
MYPFRVFISYAHEDKSLARELHDLLGDLGLVPLWDALIEAGTGFNDAIKTMITSAHVVVPLLTANSQRRPWLHQEIGFAIGRNVPVLPVAVGVLPGEMIAELHAIGVERLADLKSRLTEEAFEAVVLPVNPPALTTAVANHPEERLSLLVEHAERLLGQRRRARLRQRAPLSSFSIPNSDLGDRVWEEFDDDRQRTPFVRELLLRERRAMERLAQDSGCSLILSPELDFPRSESAASPSRCRARRVRLEWLGRSLEGMTDDQVKVVFSPAAGEGNWTILGDAVSAESQVSRPGLDWRQTLFVTHPPAVLRALRRFDHDLKIFAPRERTETSSRREALRRIAEALRACAEELPTAPGRDDETHPPHS